MRQIEGESGASSKACFGWHWTAWGLSGSSQIPPFRLAQIERPETTFRL